MVNNDQDEPLQPIIIVKRGGGDHDEHHGGVWKIAFADFMTAMMAFFLVMWLINAANEETRSQVASYFNPVKLTDAVAAPKGVRSSKPFTETEEHDDKNAEGGGGARRKGGGGSEAEEAEKDKAKEEAAATSERTLFQDPYAVLVEIAGERSPSAVPTAENGTIGQGGGLTGGEAFRDPFDPAFWLRPDDENQGEGQAEPTGADRDPAMTALVEKLPVESEDARPDTLEAAKPTKVLLAEQKTILEKKTVVETKTMPEGDLAEMSADKQKAMAKVDTGEHDPSDQQISDGEQSDAKAADPSKTVQQEPSKTEMAAAELKAEIMAAIDTAGLGQKPVLSVDRTDEGLVVSLTDDLDFGMFASASARPNAEMVKFMDRIASVLAKREGRLVVRGHTDSRPFRSQAYDNWRLSTARAHMAYHMLVRGGVDTDRFARIEGYADRDPKNKTDTEAAENRRIEILLVEKQS